MSNYKTKQLNHYAKLGTKIVSEFPYYCKGFFKGIERNKENKGSAATLYNYAKMTRQFFQFLISYAPDLHGKQIKDIEPEQLEQLSLDDIDEFFNVYLSSHYGRSVTNSEKSIDKELAMGVKARTKNAYLTALKSLFAYLEEHEIINRNIMRTKKGILVERKRRVIRMTDKETRSFLQLIKDGAIYETGKKKDNQAINAKRDYAMCLTMLDTGIRVSELVGLNIEDINFDECYFYVQRKGTASTENRDQVFFSDNLKDALLDYLGDRYIPHSVANLGPVFIVNMGKCKGQRIGVRSVERIVKRYAMANGTPEITPHKLRATYATAMIEQTGDINLVKDELGHANIQTTTLYVDTATAAKRNNRNLIANIMHEEE